MLNTPPFRPASGLSAVDLLLLVLAIAAVPVVALENYSWTTVLFPTAVGIACLFLALFLLMERPLITDWLFGFTPPQVEAPEIAAWRDAVVELQRRCGAHHYPGSPLLAALTLRAHDRGLAAEALAPTARALERHLDTAGLTSRMRVATVDGFRQLAARPKRQAERAACSDCPVCFQSGLASLNYWDS